MLVSQYISVMKCIAMGKLFMIIVLRKQYGETTQHGYSFKERYEETIYRNIMNVQGCRKQYLIGQVK